MWNRGAKNKLNEGCRSREHRDTPTTTTTTTMPSTSTRIGRPFSGLSWPVRCFEQSPRRHVDKAPSDRHKQTHSHSGEASYSARFLPNTPLKCCPFHRVRKCLLSRVCLSGKKKYSTSRRRGRPAVRLLIFPNSSPW